MPDSAVHSLNKYCKALDFLGYKTYTLSNQTAVPYKKKNRWAHRLKRGTQTGENRKSACLLKKKTNAPAPAKECRLWDLNPHGVATKGF